MLDAELARTPGHDVVAVQQLADAVADAAKQRDEASAFALGKAMLLGLAQRPALPTEAVLRAWSNWRKFATESLAARLIYRSVSGHLASHHDDQRSRSAGGGEPERGFLSRCWQVSISKAVFGRGPFWSCRFTARAY